MEINLNQNEAEYELRKYYHNALDIVASVNIKPDVEPRPALAIAEREIHAIAFLARIRTYKIEAIKLLRTCGMRNNLSINVETAAFIVEMMNGKETPHTPTSAAAVYKEITGDNLPQT